MFHVEHQKTSRYASMKENHRRIGTFSFFAGKWRGYSSRRGILGTNFSAPAVID